MLEVMDLRKSFGGLHAVNKCSVVVRKGSITGLIGPNGAGKTTLFNLITGFYKPDEGRILFNEEPIDGLLPHQIFHKRICRTFQITREFSHMTVLENLMFIPKKQHGEKVLNAIFRPGLIKNQEDVNRDKAMKVLEFVELTGLRNDYAGNLSGGHKKLLELAKTLMGDPELILLDEPGAGVNRTLMKRLVENIRVLCSEKGITFFIIEHDMNLVMNLCNPVIVMKEGKKLAEGTPEQIQRNEQVRDAYLGRT